MGGRLNPPAKNDYHLQRKQHMILESKPLSYRDLTRGLSQLKISRQTPVIVHTSLSAFGGVQGGETTLLGALLSTFETVVMPAFTYRTMLIPESGPEHNASTYGSGKDTNRMVEFYTPEMPVDPLIGVVAEALRRHPQARRSAHPILSFCGVHADQILQSQSQADPLAPVGALADRQGWVLLLGVDHTSNTSIHHAEKIAGRKQFTRWAMTPDGVRECPGFPGCSDGFDAITPYLEGMARLVTIGQAVVQAVPLQDLIALTVGLIQQDPLALLCARSECERCDAVRQTVSRGT
jgi:aminoglycoside 3-N-acetyltransferase